MLRKKALRKRRSRLRAERRGESKGAGRAEREGRGYVRGGAKGGRGRAERQGGGEGRSWAQRAAGRGGRRGAGGEDRQNLLGVEGRGGAKLWGVSREVQLFSLLGSSL